MGKVVRLLIKHDGYEVVSIFFATIFGATAYPTEQGELLR